MEENRFLSFYRYEPHSGSNPKSFCLLVRILGSVKKQQQTNHITCMCTPPAPRRGWWGILFTGQSHFTALQNNCGSLKTEGRREQKQPPKVVIDLPPEHGCAARLPKVAAMRPENNAHTLAFKNTFFKKR